MKTTVSRGSASLLRDTVGLFSYHSPLGEKLLFRTRNGKLFNLTGDEIEKKSLKKEGVYEGLTPNSAVTDMAVKRALIWLS